MIATFFRGWLMVSLVAMNTVMVAHERYGPAVLGGFFISWLWWVNSSKHRCDAKGAGVVYAAGAALGTLTGMWIGNNWG